MEKPDPRDFFDKHRKAAIHYLDLRYKPGRIACGQPVRDTYTTDKGLVTCRMCHAIANPPTDYYQERETQDD